MIRRPRRCVARSPPIPHSAPARASGRSTTFISSPIAVSSLAAGLRAERVGLAVELLHQEVELAPDRPVAGEQRRAPPRRGRRAGRAPRSRRPGPRSAPAPAPAAPRRRRAVAASTASSRVRSSAPARAGPRLGGRPRRARQRLDAVELRGEERGRAPRPRRRARRRGAARSGSISAASAATSSALLRRRRPPRPRARRARASRSAAVIGARSRPAARPPRDAASAAATAASSASGFSRGSAAAAPRARRSATVTEPRASDLRRRRAERRVERLEAFRQPQPQVEAAAVDAARLPGPGEAPDAAGEVGEAGHRGQRHAVPRSRYGRISAELFAKFAAN